MRKIALIALALSVAACGSIKTREKNDQAVNSVNKVAIVAFSENQPASARLGFNLGSGKLGASRGGSMLTQYSPHVDEMLTALATQISTNLKWTVVDTKTMTANPGYQKAFKQTMEGWQNKMPPGEGLNQFAVKGIMDFDSPRILGPQGRDELIKALGVDALVVARVDVHLNGTSVMGIGSQYPQSRLAFYVYTLGEEKPIWFEGGIDGEESKESVGKTGFIDEALLATLAKKSALTAFAKIGRAD